MTLRGIICESEASRRSFQLAERVAQTDVSVLISGESGTGKEVVARHIHDCSQRRSGAFVAVNCAAIPDQMLEAMLFGHERGAFTGAHTAREGKFEQAAGGSLLLDEISEMPAALQAKLLRVLQEREVERLGGSRVVEVDVRVIATTNRDLKQAIAEGTFREDLYYRLSVFPLLLKSLKERREDVVPLAKHFVAKHGERSGSVSTGLSHRAAAALAAHSWPGNVRELENTIQRALVMCQREEIEPEDLGLIAPEAPMTRPGHTCTQAYSLEARLLDAEIEIISQALRDHDGRKAATARALGISERTLRYKLKRWRDQGVGVAA